MRHQTRHNILWILPLLLLLGLAPVAQANEPPVADNDEYFTLPDDALSVDAPGVLGNDHDPNGDPMTAILVDSSQASGTLLLFEDGSFEYEPAAAFLGTDVFTYVAQDGTADSDEATITVTVTGTLGVEIYTDQNAFLDDLATMGHTSLREGFEHDAAWGSVRTTISGGPFTAPSINNLGITWTANNDTSEVTTGEGPVRRRQFGFFTLPHGNYANGTNCDQPVNCGDGWRGYGDARFVAIGGWIETNTPYAGLHLYLDGNLNAPIDFDGAVLGTQHQFFGVITPYGFDQFEFRETEGVIDDQKFIAADDFYLAFETNNFLKSAGIRMRLLRRGTRVAARVRVVDQDRNSVEGAMVDAQWTLPSGSTIPVNASTNSRGWVQWRTPNVGSGEYTMTVLGVYQADHVFIGGVRTETLNVP